MAEMPLIDHVAVHHPLRRVTVAVRTWLAYVVIIMVFNSVIAVPIVLSPQLRPVPFLIVAVFAFVWAWKPWLPVVVVTCSSAIAVGVGLRGLEVALYGSQFTTPARFTSASVWFLVSVTAVVLGFLNVIAISRRVADMAVWGDDA